MQLRFTALLSVFFISALARAQDMPDTMLMTSDCMTHFFQTCEKPAKLSALQLVMKNGKMQTLATFKKANYIEQYMETGLKDLDGDGKKEFILFNFTGGAHCCDQIYIFKPLAPNKYQYVTALTGGNTCIDDSNLLHFDFNEIYGYFYTCYACAYTDTTDAAPQPVTGVVLKYSKGKLSAVPGDKELRALINDNLSKLSEQPYQALKEDDFDDGLRKEFAFNLVVYHYSFGKNLAETKKLFTKYYKYPDAAKVWRTFTQDLAAVSGF